MSTRNFSQKRQIILDTIKSTTAHPSAKQVYDMLKVELPELSLGTVYRNIALFKEEGLVQSIATVMGEERLDGNTAPHAHCICRECGRVFDIMTKSDDTKAMLPNGFEADSVTLCYYGKCCNCNKK